MVESSKKDDNVYDLGQIREEAGTSVDIDLGDPISDDETDGGVDIPVNSPSLHDAGDDDDELMGRALVSRSSRDLTIRSGRKHLDLLYEQDFDAYLSQQNRIVHPEMDKYEILNAFREIRTKVIREAKGINQVIMVVSLSDHMGATFSAINLAAAFSYEGEKTSLLIDCDQRKRNLEKIFHSDNIDCGLSDYLIDSSIKKRDIIYSTGVSRMRYIPIGKRRKTTGEFFSSERMREFILETKKRYNDRYIILNVPPLEKSADAAILSEVADQVIIVIPYGKVSNHRLEKSIKLLPKEKIVGVVINDQIKYV